MTNSLVNPERPLRSAHPLVLIGGAPVSQTDLHWALERGDLAVAADGGAGALLDAGRMPDAVIGDMDSISEATRLRLPAARCHHVTEQDSTDFEKCLERIRAPVILGLGFLGGRTDHSLAALSCLVRRGARCLLIGPETVAFAAPEAIALDLPRGMWLSLFPFAAVTGRSEGLRWPIDGIGFAPSGAIGTSNEVTGPVRLGFDGPGMAVLLPSSAREAVLDALSSSGR